jgi:hypothetical protein
VNEELAENVRRGVIFTSRALEEAQRVDIAVKFP